MSLAHFLSFTSALDLLSHFCFAFRVALVSFFLSLSRSILSFSPSRSSSVSPRSSSPSVSACSNMATRCPITRLVFATVFPPSYICRRLRRRKSPHQPPWQYAVLFFCFFFRDAIHSFLFIDQYRASPYDSAFVSLVTLQTAI